MQDDIQKTEGVVVSEPAIPQGPLFQRNLPSDGVNAGAVTVEIERAIAEAQSQLALAKRFPRDMKSAYADLMEACRHRALAEAAFYSVPNRGQGPSIRLAEEIARVYGNFEYGHRELARSEDRSEIEVYAWDKEKNNRSVRHITVMHTRDTREGQKKLRDQKDIDDKIANVAAKQMRGRILALVPKWFSEAAQEECHKTLRGATDEPLEHRLRKMVDAFRKYGVQVPLIEERIGHKLDVATADDLIELTGVYNALKEGARVSDYFGSTEVPASAEHAPAKGVSGLKDRIAAKKRSKETPPAPAPVPAPVPEADDDFLPGDGDGE